MQIRRLIRNAFKWHPCSQYDERLYAYGYALKLHIGNEMEEESENTIQLFRTKMLHVICNEKAFH